MLCFVVVMQSFIMNSHEVFIHIHQGCFAGTGAIVRLPQCQWSKPDGYGKISQCITTTKHSKAKTVCIFLGIYCNSYVFAWLFLAWWHQFPLLFRLLICAFPRLYYRRLHTWFSLALQWRHNERDGVSNHQPHDCLLKCLFRHRSKKKSKPRVTGLCEMNSPATGEFPTQRASNPENVSIWWRHHGTSAAHLILWWRLLKPRSYKELYLTYK